MIARQAQSTKLTKVATDTFHGYIPRYRDCCVKLHDTSILFSEYLSASLFLWNIRRDHELSCFEDTYSTYKQ